MSSVNRPDKVTLDAYSDTQLETQNLNSVYNRFTNQLKTPILNAKGVQLLDANFINSCLQLNDNCHLMFWFFTSTSPTVTRNLTNLKCIRLHPADFVPYAGFTTFVKNRYFNSVVEVVAALNLAASTGGDSFTFNPYFQSGTVQFSYDTTTRKVSVIPQGANNYIMPAAADDPIVLDALRGTTNPTSRIRMNAFNSSNTYATATLQPYVENVSMNARLGFAMNFLARGKWWNGSSQLGCATSTGVPQFTTANPIEADAYPILLGTQNVGIYLSVIGGSGMDSTGRKNLLQTIPISVAPLNINAYSTPMERPALSLPNEIYEMTIELLDDNGTPFLQSANYNTSVALAVYY
jgi:hypothetical protein